MRRATRGQTRSLVAHRRELVSGLRTEIGLPPGGQPPEGLGPPGTPRPGAPAGRGLLVMLMGFPGVGKSHCARLLAVRLAAARVATDELRSRLFIAPSYADEENSAVFGIAEALLDDLLAEGHRVVLDATNLVARNRGPAEAVARARGVPLVHVLVTADDECARSRLAERSRDRATDDHSDADVQVYERMRARGFEPPTDGYLELRNGPQVELEIERIASAVLR